MKIDLSNIELDFDFWDDQEEELSEEELESIEEDSNVSSSTSENNKKKTKELRFKVKSEIHEIYSELESLLGFSSTDFIKELLKTYIVSNLELIKSSYAYLNDPVSIKLDHIDFFNKAVNVLGIEDYRLKKYKTNNNFKISLRKEKVFKRKQLRLSIREDIFNYLKLISNDNTRLMAREIEAAVLSKLYKGFTLSEEINYDLKYILLILNNMSNNVYGVYKIFNLLFNQFDESNKSSVTDKLLLDIKQMLDNHFLIFENEEFTISEIDSVKKSIKNIESTLNIKKFYIEEVADD